MSVTPPKWIKAQRAADCDKLLALADKWESEARDWGPDGANAMEAAAQELREALSAE